VGCSVFGSLLAHCMACELQQAGREQALLVLVDGPAALSALPLHDPAVYALHEVCRDAGSCSGALPEFALELATLPSEPAEQLRQLGAHYRPAALPADDPRWDAALLVALHRASVVRRLQGAYQPEYCFQGPATLLLPEGPPGGAFLAATRECCSGPLSYTPLECGHAECLAQPGALAAAAACISDAAVDMLSML
jgi:thioesterase domain-containing protein